MLTDLQQDRVWEAWIGAEVRANYFADLSGRYLARQRIATWVTLFTSSAAFAALVARVPDELDWIAPLLAFVTAGVTLYSLVMQHQKHAQDAADLSIGWSRLAANARALWDGMYADDAPAQLRALDERDAALSRTSMAFPVKRRLIKRWHAHVVKHHTARMAGTAA